MESAVRQFFVRYEGVFAQALAGDLSMVEVSSLYADEFIAASPAGVMAGKNDDQFRDVLPQGYARYRAIGTKAMRVRDVRVSTIDPLHCLAQVAWTAAYARGGGPDVEIDFDVHYLLQMQDGVPKVFGWISGDEQAALEAHGVLQGEQPPPPAG